LGEGAHTPLLWWKVKTHKSFSLLNIVKKASLNKSRVFQVETQNFKNSEIKCSLDKASLKMVKVLL
jgi:hypothetical protein